MPRNQPNTGREHLPSAQRDPALFDGDRQSNRIAHEARNERGCGTVEDVVRRAHLFEAPAIENCDEVGSSGMSSRAMKVR